MQLTITGNLQSEIYTPTTPPPVWTPLSKALKDCKVGLASACGVHLKKDTPFGKAGDFTHRRIPSSARADELMVTHGGYDNADVNSDINCMFPFERLKELAAEGFIKSVPEINVGFMGGGGVQDQFKSVTAPAAAKILKEQGVDICILTAG